MENEQIDKQTKKKEKKLKLLKSMLSEDASWPESADIVQVFPFARSSRQSDHTET